MKRLVLVAILVAGCGGGTASQATPPPDGSTFADPTPPRDPLDQMVLAFDGDNSRADIKSMIDGTLGMYGLPLTSENYSRAGSALVALQEEDKRGGCDKCSAMDILTQMVIDGRVKGITFAQAAAIASTELVVNQ